MSIRGVDSFNHLYSRQDKILQGLLIFDLSDSEHVGPTPADVRFLDTGDFSKLFHDCPSATSFHV